MPFIGRDWRSPGEEWVKTDEGWEKKKLLEKLARKRLGLPLDNFGDNASDIDNDANDSFADTFEVVALKEDPGNEGFQPYCPITLKCTREIAGFNGLGDAFKRLDFPNAVRDVRRFNYICKLLHLIITQNLTTLSGCAQKVLFVMLEEVASQVSTNQTNIHILQRLLGDLEKTLFTYYCWGRPLGSTVLWEKHWMTIRRINSIASRIEIKEPDDALYPRLQNLPEECVREILLRLDDHKDLQSSGQAYGVMQRVLGEQRIWRELCKFHFTRQQLQDVLKEACRRDSGEFSGKPVDWQKVYHKLRRLYGMKEEYAEILQLCRQCRCLFWKSFGHPCISYESDANTSDGGGSGNNDGIDKSTLYVPIPPQAFLNFFSL